MDTWLSWFAQAVLTKHKSLASLSNRYFISPVLGDKKSKIKVPEHSVPVEGLLPDLQTAVLALGVPTAIPCEHHMETGISLSSSSKESTNHFVGTSLS